MIRTLIVRLGGGGGLRHSQREGLRRCQGSITLEGVISDIDTSPISLAPATYLLADGSTLVMKMDACALCKPDGKTVYTW